MELKKEDKTLLSIIVPTKNRYKTLIPVISSILENIKESSFELIVQDNSEDNSSFLNSNQSFKSDKRLKYYYDNSSLSLSENTICAINNSKGEYLCFIGDDDMVSPKIFEITQNLKEKKISCLIYSCAYYWWDSVNFSKKNFYHDNKNFWEPKDISTDLKKFSSKVELKKMLKKGAISYYNLPRFYHGIVKRTVLDKIKKQTGTYLIGSCPDIAFSVSIALVIKEYYYMNYPVSVFGASSNSGGGLTAEKKHYGKIEEMNFLGQDILKNWGNYIPLIWSQKTIYTQTTYEVLKTFKIDKKLNYLPLYAAIFVHEPYLINYLGKPIINYCKYYPNLYLKLAIEIIKKTFGKLIHETKQNFKLLNYKVHNNIEPTDVFKKI